MKQWSSNGWVNLDYGEGGNKMNKLVTLIVFVVVIGVLWWALSQVLLAFAVPAPWNTLAVVAFVLIAVLSVADYFLSGSFFWKRP